MKDSITKSISNKKIMNFTFIIDIILIIFFIICIFLLLYKNFYIDLNKLTMYNYIDLNKPTMYNEKNNNNFEILCFDVFDREHKINISQHEEIDNAGNKIVYIKCKGQFSTSPSSTIFDIKIDDKTEKVYLENKKGELREIWNRNDGSLIKGSIMEYK